MAKEITKKHIKHVIIPADRRGEILKAIKGHIASNEIVPQQRASYKIAAMKSLKKPLAINGESEDAFLNFELRRAIKKRLIK